jgi:hypothetical protein
MQDTQTPDDKAPRLAWPAGQAPSDINDAAREMMTGRAAMANLLRARCPSTWTVHVDQVATAKGINASEYIRRAVADSLRADGVNLSKSAGELYDARIEHGQPQQRYAWVEGDQLRSISYSDAKPEQDGRTWLPVVHVDSEPFDIAAHWRLAPVFTIEADRVVCTFPVIPKSLEAI